ncbi:MAG TPA: hypothetical protein VKY85_28845 [Candidatus Angelobacter sp.]|nr:hypothetical protein [Candidatus Angelobacter sp.]
MDHKSHEAMRAYLLGLLSDDEAAMLEEEYFVNRAFFLQVQSEETALIEDYIEGRLRAEEKQRFEGRYLSTPDLRSKVEEVRKQHDARRSIAQPSLQPSLWKSPRLAFAAALMLSLGLGIWLYYSRLDGRAKSSALVQTPVHQNSSTEAHSPGRELAVFLSPGITKGTNSVRAQFPQPAILDTIKLILELPGESSPVQRTVRIFKLKPDGTRDKVWTSSQPVVSDLNYGLRSGLKPAPTGTTSNRARASQALSLWLIGSLFQPGDYVVEAWTIDGKMHETYECRVT